VRGKAFFLTYSQSALARDTITGWFSRQTRVKRFIVGQEHHQDGNLHWHVTIEYEVEKDVRAGSYFNVGGEHPNIKIWSRAGGSTYDQWFLNHWEYCKKEDPTPYIVGEEPKENRKRKRNEIFTEAIELARLHDVQRGMEFLEKNAPFDLLTKYEQITGHWSGCGKCDRICRHQHAVWKTFLTLHLLWTVGECCTSMDQQDWARPNGRAVFYLKLLSYLTVTSYGIATLAKELSSMISTYLIGLPPP